MRRNLFWLSDEQWKRIDCHPQVTATFPAWDVWSCQTLQTGAILTV